MTTGATLVAAWADAFLGGRVEAMQLPGGHRSGLEAVLLGASLPATFAGTVADLGSGVGVAAMCLAARAARIHALAVDRDAGAIAALRDALARPANAAFAARVTPIIADVTAPERERVAAGLGRAVADAVVMNPPFYAAGRGTISPDGNRAAAHVLDGGVEPWLRAAASVLRPGGALIVVFPASGLGDLLEAAAGRFGGVAILAVHPRASEAAHRVLFRAIKGSRAPAAILPGLILHGDSGNAYRPEIQAILRDGAGLDSVCPAFGP